MTKSLFIPLQLSLGTFVCLSASPILAQVASDGTVNTQVNESGNISEITGGETRGSNLFHSFQDFSVPTGNEAFFNNAESISNIFSRVTGGNISNIDGLIRANGSASLFLINPAGIVFGENARLDIGGSFFGSTADSILFDGGEFSATDLTNPLLTINAPIGLNLRDNPGDITVRGDGNGLRLEDTEPVDTQDALRVGENATIGFLGGNVLFEDATVKTAGGRIEVGSVADGTVNLVAVDNGLTFDYSGIDTFRDISLSGTSSIDASGVGGGNLQVAGNNIDITGVSGFSSVTLGSTPGEDINIFAAESIDISGVENEQNFVSFISTRIFPSGTADAGNINIETGSITIGDRATISTSVSGEGNAGNIDINATDSITLASQGNNSTIFSGVNAGAFGNSGNVNVNTQSLDLQNGGLISTSVSGEGNAGNVTINATDSVILASQENTSQIFSGVNAGAVGDGGNVNLTANSFTLSDGSFVNTENSANGRAGDITINATEDVSFSNNSGLFVTGAPGGFINISAKNLSITSGSSFFAGADGETISSEGQSGDITINLEEDLTLDGLESDNSTTIVNSSFGTGNPGDIDINARNITFQNGGDVFAFSAEQEATNIGNITLNATGDIVFDGTIPSSSRQSGISNFIPPNLSGSIGNVNITAQNLAITNGARISSSVSGIGDSGNINLNVASSIVVDGFGEVTTDESGTATLSSEISSVININGTGNAGTININTQNLELSRNGRIDANTFGLGDGGDININAERITIGQQGNTNTLPSYIQARTVGNTEGDGGNITINTGSLFISDGGSVDASVNNSVGNGGNIEIDARDTVSVAGSGIVRDDSEFSSSIRVSTLNSVGNAGDIEINTANLSIADGALVSADILGDGSVTNTGDGGSIAINASDSIDVSGQGRIEVDVLDFNSTGNAGNLTLSTQRLNVEGGGEITADTVGNGNGGDVIVSTGNLTISDGSKISTNTFGEGDGGSLTITATESIELNGSTETEFVTSISAEANGNGNGGNVVVSTGNLVISDAAQISATTSGEGDGGSLTITATESIELDNSTEFETGIIADAEGSGNGGDLIISTGNITISDAIISATTLGDGDAGSLTITAAESIELDNFTEFDSGIFAAAIGNGDSGDVVISTGDLTISNGAAIFVATLGDGNGGSLTITATESIELDNSTEFNTGIFADAVGNGNSGNVVISTRDLTISNGARISTITSGDGNGGSLNITATESIELDNSTEFNTNGIFASALQGSGNGGDIVISTGDLTISNGASVAASNFSSLSEENGGAAPGTGQPGNIDITADSINLFDRGRIEAVTQSAEGIGANITLQVDEDISLRDGSSISARAFGEGNGGNLTLDSRFIVAFPSNGNGSDIIASAEQGQGGNITISAESLLGIQERPLNNLTNDINASSQVSGLDGTIDIINPEVDPVQGATELPSNVVVPEETAQQACRRDRVAAAQNSFSIEGRGGITPEPGLPLNSSSIYVDGVTDSTSTIPAPIETAQGKIQPARGIKVTEDGKIILTAYRTNSAGERLPETNNCG